MSDAIEGASVSVKTMADGTLRLTVDIEPRNAQAAFALFGAPGRAMALAALKDGAGALNPGETFTGVDKTPVKPKGGEWAKLAGMWCADPDFWKWANSVAHGGVFWHINTAKSAGEFVREQVEIETRADLDHDAAALARFNYLIRLPFMAWMEEQGIQK